MSPELNSVNKSNKKLVARQRPLRDRRANFGLIIYSRSSTNLANLTKIDLVDVEIIGLKSTSTHLRSLQLFGPGCAYGLACCRRIG